MVEHRDIGIGITTYNRPVPVCILFLTTALKLGSLHKETLPHLVATEILRFPFKVPQSQEGTLCTYTSASGQVHSYPRLTLTDMQVQPQLTKLELGSQTEQFPQSHLWDWI